MQVEPVGIFASPEDESKAIMRGLHFSNRVVEPKTGASRKDKYCLLKKLSRTINAFDVYQKILSFGDLQIVTGNINSISRWVQHLNKDLQLSVLVVINQRS